MKVIILLLLTLLTSCNEDKTVLVSVSGKVVHISTKVGNCEITEVTSCNDVNQNQEHLKLKSYKSNKIIDRLSPRLGKQARIDARITAEPYCDDVALDTMTIEFTP